MSAVLLNIKDLHTPQSPEIVERCFLKVWMTFGYLLAPEIFFISIPGGKMGEAWRLYALCAYGSLLSCTHTLAILGG